MKIKSLRLENFQGIKHAEFDFDGLSASIYGDNATGKTTVFNAVTWLLFNKASTEAKNFTPKTKGSDGDLHNLDHAVRLPRSGKCTTRFTRKSAEAPGKNSTATRLTFSLTEYLSRRSSTQAPCRTTAGASSG